MSSKKFLPSKYTHLVESDTGNLLIYCADTFSFVKVGGALKEKVKALFDSAEPISKEDIPQVLIHRGFFVPEDYDYDTILTMRYLNLVNSSEVLRISILTTGQCNFRCLYCNEPFIEGKMTEEVQDSIIAYIKKKLLGYKSLRIDWFGGEPLMALDVIRRMSQKLMEICRAYKKPYTASITTNGYYLTKDVFEELLKYKVINYQITIDGTKEVHDAQRMLANGEGTYDVIMKNFSDIHKYVKSQMFEIALRTNFTKPALDNLGDYLCEIEKVIEDDRRFTLYPAVADDWGGERTSEIKEDLLEGSREDGYIAIMKAFERHRTKLSVNSFLTLLVPRIRCIASQKNFYAFSPKGIMHKCTNEFLLDGTSKIGEYRNRKWEVDAIEESKWLLQPINELNECKTCFLFPVCLNTICPKVLYQLKYREPNINKDDIKKMKFCHHGRSIVDDILRYSEEGTKFYQLTENDFKGVQLNEKS